MSVLAGIVLACSRRSDSEEGRIGGTQTKNIASVDGGRLARKKSEVNLSSFFPLIRAPVYRLELSIRWLTVTHISGYPIMISDPASLTSS